MNTKNLLKLVIIFFISNFINAQTEKFDSLLNLGINQIYNIKFDDAEKTFSKVQKEFPKHPAGKFFDAMIVWWKIMIDQDNEEYDEIFEEKLENVIDFCDDLLDENDENVDAIFFKGGSLGFRGRLYSIRQKWFDAALDGKDALPLVYEAYEIDPKNEDVKLGFGIYNYYAEAIPEKYPFIKPAMIFIPKGDKKKGIEQLTTAAKKAKYAAIESKFFLLTSFYQFEEDFDKALIYAEELSKMFPNNPIFEKYVGRIYTKKNDYTQASKIFKSMMDKNENKLLGYNKSVLREASYYVAVEQMRKNQIDLAKKNFLTCEEVSRILDKNAEEESGFLISALVYLAKINEQQGDKNNAVKINKELLRLRDYNGSHEKAKMSLKRIKV
ncbi:MAG: tetratricopeptide repeat protein [Melioribacteraceae bacterium]